MSDNGKLGILVAGGPAPGINSVIGSATIRAALHGVEVIGIRDGFEWIMRGDTAHATTLSIDEVSRIHFRGGSHLGISRANPNREPDGLDNSLGALKSLGVSRLITIGGDDTAFSAMKLEERAGGRIQVVHVPKTIDNDLDLPAHVDTFGYQTARHFGVEIVKNLMVDARTTSRWYFVVPLPRFAEIVVSLLGAIDQRLLHGHRDGVAVIAEGLVLSLEPGELSQLADVERDAHGNVRLAEVNIGEIIKRAVSASLQALGIRATVVAKNIGYELRCADPIPFDLEYTRDLGYCAAKFVLGGGNAAMVSMQGGHFVPVPFAELLDPETGRARVRMVDVRSTRYAIARRYMIRLRRDDFESPEELARLSAAAKLEIPEFRRRFEPLVARELPSLKLDVAPSDS
jgi:6-phosphofructokinase